MSEHKNRPEPKLSRTDFESMTHEQLAAMLESADMASAAHLASKLSKAASTISKIGDDLMKHVKDLEWQGKAGDSFRDWGGHTASATLRLGDYAGAASQWMSQVSQAIAEAKTSMPDTSETTKAQAVLADAHKTIAAAKQPGARNDPDARKAAETAHSDATSAQFHIDATRQDAIQQMRKLAETYEHSASQINGLTPPTFAPAVGRTGDADWWERETEYLPASRAGATGAAGSTYSGASVRSAGSGSAQLAAPHRSLDESGAISTPARPSVRMPASSEPVSLGIDSADTLPRVSSSPAAPSPAVPALAPREASQVGLPIGLPPTFASGGRGLGSPLASGIPGPTRLPQVPGLAKPLEGMSRMPRETGIMGGRPVSATGRPANGIPRGTVIGNENGQTRAPLGRAMSPGSMAGEGGRLGGGTGSGRRLASETGGVVGGTRAGQPTRVGGRPFTAGGSGLVRPSATSEARGSQAGRIGAASPAHSRKSQGQHDKRPDYLVEDEETWTGERRRPLPPVVD
ncbi:WXG100 family type VII secretion target [Streptomyces bauhiniae]|uniref:WXG100 family type VII secretion target n=1 Tax=Streptomyces bauhiniae TaxID=2340725 RepID=UPI0033B814D0